MTLNKDIKIIENFLPQESWQGLYAVMTHTMFPWFFNVSSFDYGDDSDGPLEDYQFVHSVYHQDKPNSDMFPHFVPFLEKLAIRALLRIKINCTTWRETPYMSPWHTDFKWDDVTTGVWYLNTNNGGTRFKDGSFVQSKANRMVLFPALIEHAAVGATDVKQRIVVNFNYF